MKRNQLVLIFASVSIVFLLVIGYQQQSAIAESVKNTAESPAKNNSACPACPLV